MEDMEHREREKGEEVEEVDTRDLLWEEEKILPPPEPAQDDSHRWEEGKGPESPASQLYHRLHSSGGNVLSVQPMPNADCKEERENNPRLPPENEPQRQQMETMLIQNKDFQEIQKMEQTMMQITTLLNQFSSLIEEQQNEIVAVHDQARTSRENVSKGTENIVDATERGKRSRHYLPKFIFFLAVLLLFLNWIIP